LKNFKIKLASVNSVEIKILTNELHKDLELIYGKGMIEEFIDENEQMLIFYAAYDESENAVACGALKHFDDQTAEIKRMYVKPEYRGRGLSKTILSELEDKAKELNYNRLLLETGLKQPEAMSLYNKFGYKTIKCYGKHVDDPDSRCFEKFIY
jgi:GNAT superfamily N-acetyltransferase